MPSPFSFFSSVLGGSAHHREHQDPKGEEDGPDRREGRHRRGKLDPVGPDERTNGWRDDGLLIRILFQFKKAVSKEFGDAPVEQLCLIFSGKIVKDHDTLETHHIKDGMTVHLVIKSGGSQPSNRPAAASSGSASAEAPRPPPPNPSQTPFGLGGLGGLPGMANLGMGSANFMEMQQQVQEGMRNNPDFMRQIMDSPLTQSLMSNPEIMRSLIQSNPQMRQVRGMILID